MIIKCFEELLELNTNQTKQHKHQLSASFEFTEIGQKSFAEHFFRKIEINNELIKSYKESDMACLLREFFSFIQD